MRSVNNVGKAMSETRGSEIRGSERIADGL